MLICIYVYTLYIYVCMYVSEHLYSAFQQPLKGCVLLKCKSVKLLKVLAPFTDSRLCNVCLIAVGVHGTAIL